MFISMSVSLGVGASGVHKPACVYVTCTCSVACGSVRVAGVRACVGERGVLSTAVVGLWSCAAIGSSKFMLPHDPRFYTL